LTYAWISDFRKTAFSYLKRDVFPENGRCADRRIAMKLLGVHKRAGFSLMELLAVVTILGIIAAIIVPRVAVSSDTAKIKVNAHNKATINAAVERWYIEKGTWPANNLSDIGADINYFPDSVPVNPTDGTAYTLNATTHRVN
jgi:prepilin-type N-terminal cleavage/methylation domain-containing protein